MDVGVRLISEADLPALTVLQEANRTFLAPWEPARPADFFTAEQQRRQLANALEAHRAGTLLPLLIVEGEEIVGRINLLNIIRGALQSADLGYWVSAAHNGRGIATAAVGATVDLAFGELELHRLQAGTLVHNAASQRVLQRNGFVRFGLAPRYLHIAGRWQDHVLFQRLNDQLE